MYNLYTLGNEPSVVLKVNDITLCEVARLQLVIEVSEMVITRNTANTFTLLGSL